VVTPAVFAAGAFVIASNRRKEEPAGKTAGVTGEAC